MTIRIRKAEGERDLGFMLGLGHRLAAVIETELHEQAEIRSFQDAFSAANLRDPAMGSLSLIAENVVGVGLGFLHALPGADGITGQKIGYVALLAVTDAAEGTGVARQLLAAAEDWAREQGYAALSLDVFASNHRGRNFYEKNGFAAETLRLVKKL
ncbi:GNAT family N-acetyltransferase [Labrys sp. KNU-23]|uniref:GNAT family N-acetyltransferase n=1 Tax=Labrys sp. KNU-23 TaxID=2789216 RepID=UPI0011EF3FB6|nr:GNAT family N-acetyltransferase [Labrys sp. KNU-23]QEN86811.1 GNAT family N-acetyltransferase [Labrys sp. KNU-23]